MKPNSKELNIFLLLVSGFIFLSGLLHPIPSSAEDLKVLIIPSSDSIIYTKAIENIYKTSNKIGSNIIFNTISLSDIDNISNTIPDNIDLLIPVGQLAFEKTIERYGNYPILVTLISRFGFSKIVKKLYTDNNNANVGAIYLDQPLIRYFNFAQLALPNNKKLGFLLSNEYRNIFTEFDSTVTQYLHHIEIYNKDDNLIRSLSRVMENSDVIVALPDFSIFNRRNTHNILLSSYRKLIPVIGFSGSYVKAGSLAGLYSTPELIGKQTGEVINTLANTNPIGKLPRLHAKYFQISVNNKVARSLGLPSLDDIVLRKKLLNTERSNDD